MSQKQKENTEIKVLASSRYGAARLILRGVTAAFVPALWILVLWALNSDPTVSRSALGTVRTVLSAFAGLALLVTLAALLSDLDSRLEVTSRAIIHRLGRPWARVLTIPFSEVEQVRLASGSVQVKRRAKDGWINLGREWRELPTIERALRSKLGDRVR